MCDFNSLSASARTRVKHYLLYIDKDRVGRLKTVFEKELEIFPNSDIRVEFNFSYGKSDGINFYGNLFVSDFIDYIFMVNETKKEIRYSDNMLKMVEQFDLNSLNNLKNYIGQYSIELKKNQNENNIKLRTSKIRPYNAMVSYLKGVTIIRFDRHLSDIEKGIKSYFRLKSNEFKKYGYDYLHTMSDSEAIEIIKENVLNFDKDGNLI